MDLTENYTLDKVPVDYRTAFDCMVEVDRKNMADYQLVLNYTLAFDCTLELDCRLTVGIDSVVLRTPFVLLKVSPLDLQNVSVGRISSSI